MIRTLIIDDEPAIRKDLQVLLARNPEFLCIGTCGSIAEGLVLIEATKPDLLLLDIELSDGNSFELLQQLKATSFQIIFITAYNDRAVKAIKWGALDYLMKPVDDQELAMALAKVHSGENSTSIQQIVLAKEKMKDGVPKRLALRMQDCVEIVVVDEIVYCQSDGGYTTFFMADGRKLLVSRTLKEFESLLREPVFIRPHQSYLVSVAAIVRYHKDGLLELKNGLEIPVATRRREMVLDTLTGL